MLLGSRVVRGPDWKVEEQGDHDGGEGFVGTITSLETFQDGSALPKDTVLVCWDTGFQSCYRAGKNYDLRILDSASAGVKFSAQSCSGCNRPAGIAGMRWHCAECPNYDLCTYCYMNDLHDGNHSFLRFDRCNSAKGVPVGRRFSSTKIQAKGTFPGAIVKTGKDWTLEPLENGVVLNLDSWEDGTQRSAALVAWIDFCELLLRVGHEGKVDLELVKCSWGPVYYEDHLPKVSLDDMIIEKQFSYVSEKKSTIQSKLIPDQQKELQQKLTQRLHKHMDNINPVKEKSPPLPPPRTLPKPSPRQRNDNSIKSIVEPSEVKHYQTAAARATRVKDMVRTMSRKDDPALPKPSKKSRPAPPPPRPHSTILSGFERMSHGLEKKEVDIAPSSGSVAGLAANLGAVLRFDPTRNCMQSRRTPERELICISCDEKASKVIFDPCGHFVDVNCLGCARKLKRCSECKEAIDMKTTQDGERLAECDNKTDRTKELEKQLAEVTREVECPICMDERSNILFSCGHRTCTTCSDQLVHCPLCNQYITDKKRMF